MKEIPLTQNQFAIIDDCDFGLVSQYKWRTKVGKGTYYAVTTVKAKPLYMHRLILNVTERKNQVDHIDWNGLNNTRANLRIVSHRDNCSNRKAGKVDGLPPGVFKHREGQFRARLTADGKRKSLGIFSTPEDASNAYKAARERIGDPVRI
jgi:hypothetical protein